MKDLSQSRKNFYIVLVIMIAGLFLSAVPLFLAGILTPPADDEWDGWDKLAIEYLEQQEGIAERYDDEYTFRCTRAHYGYVQGEPMYDENGTQLPTDIEITIAVYKGSALFAFIRDEYTVYFVRNDDGTYRADRYEIRNELGSLIWKS